MSALELATTAVPVPGEGTTAVRPLASSPTELAAVVEVLWRRSSRPVDDPMAIVDHRPRRVHIISGSYGAGHDAAAREIARRLERLGHSVSHWDVVDLFPLGLGRIAKWLYLKQLELLPRSWGSLLARLQPGTPALRAAHGVIGLARLRIQQIARSGADLLISTHPFASQALGQLRASGDLRVPTITCLVDASVHPLWVNPDVDLHLGLHPGAVRAAECLGGRAVHLSPLVPDAYSPHSLITVNERLDVRRGLGLRPTQRMVLVVGGSLGIGQLRHVLTTREPAGLVAGLAVLESDA